MEELIEGVNAKVCSTCKTVKLFTDFHKDKNRKYGRVARCKSCTKSYDSKYYSSNREYILLRKKDYHEENATEIRLKQATKYLKNREYLREQQAEYAEINRHEIASRAVAYRSANLEKFKEKEKQYRIVNKYKFNSYKAKRRAAKIQRTPNWLTAKDVTDIEDFYYLAKALSDITGVKYHVDHVIPLQGKLVSGLHVPGNLQILTESENSSKGNKFIIE